MQTLPERFGLAAVALLALTVGWADAQMRPYPWPGGEIPFGIENNVPPFLRYKIQQAMMLIQQNTCIRFFHVPQHPRAIRIRVSSDSCGANAMLGFTYQNVINYGRPDCMDMNVVTHELLHQVGLAHEHSRGDSRNFVIKFDGYDKDEGRADSSMGMPYDYMSIMHYSENLPFFKIRTRDPRYQKIIGMTQQPDAADYEKVCRLYRCSNCPGSGK